MDQQKRIVPNLNRVPEVAAVETAATYQITDASICPACKTKMKKVMASGIPAWVCVEDRVCLPQKTGG